MGEIRIVGPGKTRGYHYTVCKTCNSSMMFAFSMEHIESTENLS